MTRRHRAVVIVAAVFVVALGAFVAFGRGIWYPLLLQITGPRTVADVLAKYGPAARRRLMPHFQRAGVKWPPREITFIVLKQERRMAVWARNDATWKYIRSYPILAASGHAGPKLRQGDYQVPEGVYRIAHLNPMSSYHLSMKVDYPNAFDKRMAQRDGRTNLGGDIFIHGKAVSIGCVALGDPAIEELFTLVAQTGHSKVKVILAPNDLRIAGPVFHDSPPRWIRDLYATIRAALREYPVWLESDNAIDVQGDRKFKIFKSAPKSAK